MTTRKRILVVDDEEPNRILLEAILESMGFESEMASSGAEALAMLTPDIDLVLLDVMMPGLDGFEVARRARQAQDLADVPIIMVTGLSSKEDRLRAVEAGANDFVTKPIDRVELRVRMASLLKMKEAQDAIKRHRAELEMMVESRTAALRESEARTRLLIESSPIGIMLFHNGCFSYVNPAFARIFGYSDTSELVGMPMAVAFAEPDRNLLSAKAAAAMARTDSDEFVELRCVKRNSHLLDANVWLKATEFKGEPALLGFLVDVSEQKALRGQLMQAQKMEALGTLAGGIAHDFNNILFAIMGFTELAAEDTVPGSRVHSNLHQVMTAANRAKDLVGQILTFSRQSEEQKRPVDITPVMKETFKFIRASTPATIDIRAKINARAGLICADPTQIHQVLMNLCANSAHAMKDKGGELTVTLERVNVDHDFANCHPRAVPGPHIKIKVADTGHGMHPEVLARVFEPYYTTKKQGEGTGLGLAVVHGIVTGHGGTITVESKPGVGTAFRVYFPLAAAEAVCEQAGDGPAPAGTERLLLIDDEHAVVQMARQILERLGYSVEARTSSVEALELFRVKHQSYDLVISDVTMPNMTGIELSKELLRIRPDIPIILCTGFSDNLSRERIGDMGIAALVMKPVVKGEMARTIRRVLDQPR